jgi:hypothetical protein
VIAAISWSQRLSPDLLHLGFNPGAASLLIRSRFLKDFGMLIFQMLSKEFWGGIKNLGTTQAASYVLRGVRRPRGLTGRPPQISVEAFLDAFRHFPRPLLSRRVEES